PGPAQGGRMSAPRPILLSALLAAAIVGCSTTSVEHDPVLSDQRAGHPNHVSRWAQPTDPGRYDGYLVGGGAVGPGEGPTRDWGMKYGMSSALSCHVRRSSMLLRIVASVISSEKLREDSAFRCPRHSGAGCPWATSSRTAAPLASVAFRPVGLPRISNIDCR